MNHFYINKICIPFKTHNSHFSSSRLNRNSNDNTYGSLLELTHFIMSGPTFPPYPCSGIFLITYVLECSEGILHTTSSPANERLVGPAELILTMSSKGLIYDEKVSDVSDRVEAIQLMLALPDCLKNTPPISLHISQQSGHIIRNGANKIRLVSGVYNNSSCNIVSGFDFTLAELHIFGNEKISKSLGDVTYLYQVTGCSVVEVDDRNFHMEPGSLILIDSAIGEGSAIEIIAGNYSNMIFLSVPGYNKKIFRNESVCMNSEKELETAIEDYMKGSWKN